MASALLAASLPACTVTEPATDTPEPSSASVDAQGYVAVLADLADALDEVVASPTSSAAVERVLSLIDEAASYAPAFASLPPAQAQEIADRYGAQVQTIALRIATSAQQAINASGDDRILEALQGVPSFAIATQTQAP